MARILSDESCQNNPILHHQSAPDCDANLRRHAYWRKKVALYYLSDKLDDAARYIQDVDYKLGAKSYPAWFRSLVDDEVK